MSILFTNSTSLTTAAFGAFPFRFCYTSYVDVGSITFSARTVAM